MNKNHHRVAEDDLHTAAERMRRWKELETQRAGKRIVIDEEE